MVRLPNILKATLVAITFGMVVILPVAAPPVYADSEELRIQLSENDLASYTDWWTLIHSLFQDAIALIVLDDLFNTYMTDLTTAGFIAEDGDTFRLDFTRNGADWRATYAAIYNLGNQRWEYFRVSVGVLV